MRRIAVVAVVLSLVAASPALAQKKDCEELKGEIAKKIEANGVKEYTLEVVPAKDAAEAKPEAKADTKADSKEGKADAKVVGTCDGGAKKITYVRK